jgi:hypothetical protein
MSNLQVHLDKLKRDEIEYLEREQLLKQIHELYQIQQDLNEVILEQNPKLNLIESNIDISNINIEHGTSDIKQAESYSFSKIPIFIGFILGGSVGLAIGGPVGAVAGAKTAGLLGGMVSGAVVGSSIGFVL